MNADRKAIEERLLAGIPEHERRLWAVVWGIDDEEPASHFRERQAKPRLVRLAPSPTHPKSPPLRRMLYNGQTGRFDIDLGPAVEEVV